MLMLSLLGTFNTKKFRAGCMREEFRSFKEKGVWGSSPRKCLNDYMQKSAFFDSQWSKF